MKYTRCQYCLKTVGVRDGVVNYHVPVHFSKKCEGAGKPPLWVEEYKLSAHGRNSQGHCMKCGKHVDDGPQKCSQCNYEVRNAKKP